MENKKSKYVYKAVKTRGYDIGLGYGYIDKIHEQLVEESEKGWDFYKSIDVYTLVFRKKRF